jgi:protein required for attachment to host cells
MFWIVTGNSNQYRIYNYQREKNDLQLLKEVQDPEAKKKSSDLAADAPGHYIARDAVSGTYAPRVDPKEEEIDQFIKKLADELAQGRTHNQYQKLILILPPRVNGILMSHLDKQIAHLVAGRVEKDYHTMPIKEFHKFIHDDWLDIVNND